MLREVVRIPVTLLREQEKDTIVIPHNFVESTFICLLPSEEDAARLHRTFDALFSIHAFPCIKLPLHITLYFFPESASKNNADAIDWIQSASRASKCPIVASTQDVQCFQKDGQDFVYYLPVSSETILHLHDDLSEKFQHVHTDPFDFIPHLSLFYPDRNLTEDERHSVQQIYNDMANIKFDRLAFVAEKENGKQFLRVQAL